MSTDPRVETLKMLGSIDATLKAILLVLSEQRNDAPQGESMTSRAADDRDLDSQWGDEKVKFQPRDWIGSSFKGLKMSECPAEFLDQYAASCDYFAQRNDEKHEKDEKGRPKSFYDTRTARRARGWAARLRAGWKGNADSGGWASDEPAF